MSESNRSGSSTADQLPVELFQFCQSDSLSEEGLRTIIEKYGLTPNNNRHRHGDSTDFCNALFFFWACHNERVTEAIIRLLIEYFPDAPSTIDQDGNTPLHYACYNQNMTANMIQLLIEAAPDSVRHARETGELPIHYLCHGSVVNENVKIQVLKLLVDEYPESTRHAIKNGNLPLHYAACDRSASDRSTEFCRILVESYPDSVRDRNSDGYLPLHYACSVNTLPTVEYLYNLYPDATNHATRRGQYPIHCAIANQSLRTRQITAVDIVQFLLDCDPKAKLQKCGGQSLLHFACMQKREDDSNVEASASVQIIEAIHDAHPESIRCTNEIGNLPIHHLCNCNEGKFMKDEKVAMTILKLLIKLFPESIRHTNNEGNLPLHYACRKKSPEFCQILTESYPDSVRVSNRAGIMPLHYACNAHNRLPTVEYLCNLYPDAINHATMGGVYPIHWTIMSPMRRNNPKAAGIVQFLLDSDPRVKLQKFRGNSLLCIACGQKYDDSTIEAGIKMIKAIYDAYPEAIQDTTIFVTTRWHEQVQSFINSEIVYARRARILGAMVTPDENGQLPLHRALQNNVRLGSIKLLVKGNRSAPTNASNNGSLPLHLACQYHESPRVIAHLIDLYPTTLRRVDSDQNTVLHFACRGANYSAIALLLDKYDATSVSMRNGQNELPMYLLFKSSAVEDRESIEYTDCVFRLLKAHPEVMIMKSGAMMGRTSSATSSSPRCVGKKRKFSDDE